MTGNEYAAETDWSKEQDKGKVSKGRNTKCQNRSIQISSLNDTREKILPGNGGRSLDTVVRAVKSSGRGVQPGPALTTAQP